MNSQRLRSDFDELARLADGNFSTGRYETVILQAIPESAHRVLDVGCGSGKIARALARDDRTLVGVDLSPGMIERASQTRDSRVQFRCADFFELELQPDSFDCIVSSAALHHMPATAALQRMTTLLRPGGRLIIHDIPRNTQLQHTLQSGFALAHETCRRLLSTGRLRSSREVRDFWKRHSTGEVYLSRPEVRELVTRFLPGATIRYHWHWRYTVIWDKPAAA